MKKLIGMILVLVAASAMLSGCYTKSCGCNGCPASSCMAKAK